MCFPIPGSGGSRNSLTAGRHDDVAFFVIPAIAEVELDRRWSALIEKLFQLGLVVLFENLDRPEVGAEDADVPFVPIEISEWNTGVVLHNDLAMIENEIANAAEALFKHQIG